MRMTLSQKAGGQKVNGNGRKVVPAETNNGAGGTE